jgi:hypothetical protein
VYLPLGPRFADSNQSEAMDFLSTIKIHSTPSFGGKAKPEAPCHKNIQQANELYKCERNTS